MKLAFLGLSLFAVSFSAFASGDAAKGYQALRGTHMAVAPGLGTIAESEWDSLYLVFPKELREKIEKNPALKQELTRERYGAVADADPSVKRPVGFFSKKNGQWEMNCLTCHAGTVTGKNGKAVVYFGAPNSNFDLMTFFEDRLKLFRTDKTKSSFSLQTKMQLKPYAKLFETSPLNRTRGTYNVWPSGDLLAALRTKDMGTNWANFAAAFTGNIKNFGTRQADLDPPAWWNTKYRDRFWIDGFAPKEPRMNAIQILPQGNPIAKMDQEFTDMLAFIESVPAPKYPFEIKEEKAARGKIAFEKACVKCHGSYEGSGATEVVSYPNKTVHADVIGTDLLRLQNPPSTEYRQFLKDSWIGRYGQADVRVQSDGYMAPPLRGVWATAPYFHNGSVPTLYGVLFPNERPAIWKAELATYNEGQVGLNYSVADRASVESLKDTNEKRRFVDTQNVIGKGNGGHLFPERLTVDERKDLLEYLKTL